MTGSTYSIPSWSVFHNIHTNCDNTQPLYRALSKRARRFEPAADNLTPIQGRYVLALPTLPLHLYVVVLSTTQATLLTAASKIRHTFYNDVYASIYVLGSTGFFCAKTFIRNVLQIQLRLTFWRRNFLLNFSTPVFKMWIIHKPKKVALWNKRHFEEEKTEIMQHV